jgi:hypothetical protein
MTRGVLRLQAAARLAEAMENPRKAPKTGGEHDDASGGRERVRGEVTKLPREIRIAVTGVRERGERRGESEESRQEGGAERGFHGEVLSNLQAKHGRA